MFAPHSGPLDGPEVLHLETKAWRPVVPVSANSVHICTEWGAEGELHWPLRRQTAESACVALRP